MLISRKDDQVMGPEMTRVFSSIAVLAIRMAIETNVTNSCYQLHEVLRKVQNILCDLKLTNSM